MKSSSVAIVGQSTLFREGLQALLRRSVFTVCSSTANLDIALHDFEQTSPDLVILALSDYEELSARIAQIKIHHIAASKQKFVLLAPQMDAEMVREAAAAGVQAVLSKEISGEVLQRSLELILLGQQVFPGLPEEPIVRQVVLSNAPLTVPLASPEQKPTYMAAIGTSDKMIVISAASVGLQRNITLSDRERQILRCLVEGAANKMIARTLSITEATVKVHIKGLLRKIRVSNRTQAAVWGLNNSTLFDDPPICHVDQDFHMKQQASF